MSIALQLILNGIIAGGIYALVAAGFSLIYTVAKFMHFAHGAVLAFAAYFAFFFISSAHLNFWLAAVLSLVLTVALGAFINWGAYKPLRKKKASSAVLLIASLALMTLFNALILLLFGTDVKTLSGFPNIIYDVVGVRITLIQIVIIVVSAILLVVLRQIMYKTRLGRAMRALADNKDVAQTVGVNPERIYMYAFMIGSFLAGIAGILIGVEQNLVPEMGVSLIIKGFTGAIIGGVGSVHGAVVGSLFLGIVENVGIWWLPSGYKDAIAFGLLFIFLLFRPQGIFGKKKREEAGG